jgi:molybdate/tungstate transport system substrate-binding protein
MVFQLSELYYGDEKIFDELILDNTAITISEEEDGTYLIKTPEDMKPNTEKVSIRPKSVELVALVEVGGLDYAFEYRSVAVQHNLSYVDLPAEIDLGNVIYEDFYNTVKVQRADEEIITASTIIYGITVPKNAENPELGLEFVKFVIGDAGQKIIEDTGQTPIVPPEGSGNLPEELKGMIAVAPTPSPTHTLTPTPTPTPKEPGFEVVFAIAGLLAIAYLMLRRREE